MNNEPAPCPICEARADFSRPEDGEYETVSCWECGCFKISGSARPAFKAMPIETRRAHLTEARAHVAAGQVAEVKV